MTVRDRLVARRARTVEAHYRANPNFVYYLSAEYLLGRQLGQNTLYTGTDDVARRALTGRRLLLRRPGCPRRRAGPGQRRPGPAGRLLARFPGDPGHPAVGYGIRYEYGIFKQAFEDGYQVEHPDDWTFYGIPWEFAPPTTARSSGSTGTPSRYPTTGRAAVPLGPGRDGARRARHMLVPGYGTETVNILRLWRARAGQESFDLALFNAGDYVEAVEAQCGRRTSPRCCTPTTTRRPAGNCG